MISAMKILALAGAAFFAGHAQGSAIAVSAAPPANASAPPLEAFVSYSIEFSSFPDFAGAVPHQSHPFSSNSSQETRQHRTPSPTTC
jgi:hypothetical protein